MNKCKALDFFLATSSSAQLLQSTLGLDPAQLPLGQRQALAEVPGEGSLSWLLPPGEGDGVKGERLGPPDLQ